VLAAKAAIHAFFRASSIACEGLAINGQFLGGQRRLPFICPPDMQPHNLPPKHHADIAMARHLLNQS